MAGRRDRGAALTRVILQIFKLNGRLLAAGDRLVEDVGLSSAKWQVLGAIALAHTPQPVANIARMMGLSRQAVQRTVNELRAMRLLEFAPNPHHQTAQLVLLTRNGRAAYATAHERQRPWADALAQGLREGELTIAERVLSQLTERLETAERSAVSLARRRKRPRVKPGKPRRVYGEAR